MPYSVFNTLSFNLVFKCPTLNAGQPPWHNLIIYLNLGFTAVFKRPSHWTKKNQIHICMHCFFNIRLKIVTLYVVNNFCRNVIPQPSMYKPYFPCGCQQLGAMHRLFLHICTEKMRYVPPKSQYLPAQLHRFIYNENNVNILTADKTSKIIKTQSWSSLHWHRVCTQFGENRSICLKVETR